MASKSPTGELRTRIQDQIDEAITADPHTWPALQHLTYLYAALNNDTPAVTKTRRLALLEELDVH